MAVKTSPSAPKGKGTSGTSRRDKLASFEAARKKEQRNLSLIHI